MLYLHSELTNIGPSHRRALSSCQDAHAPNIHASNAKRAPQEDASRVKISFYQLIIGLAEKKSQIMPICKIFLK